MKKLLIVFSLIGSLYTTRSFAQDKTPTAVSKSFQSSFTDAKEVRWAQVDNLYKADFTFDGQNVAAFFDGNGTVVATARNLTVLQLPISLQTNLKKSYPDYTVSTLFEVDNEAGATYYITIQTPASSVQLKSTAYGTWDAYQKNRTM